MESDKNSMKDEPSKAMARKLVADGKAYASEGELYKSLKCFKKAYKLFPTEKIQSRIERIQQAMDDEDEDEENMGFIELDNGMVIFKKLVERLFPHQIEGVKWLYDLYQSKKKGGILADDMGLGKTIQIIAFASAMFDMQLVKHILLVLPLSVIPTWKKEFENWAPGIKVDCFHGASQKRMAVLRQCMRKQSVCITTYGLMVTQWKVLSETIHGTEFTWDYIILDEGHKIKNRSKTTKSLHAIPSKNRIILTGTPIQNRVRDMWALMDWVTQGSLLGTQKTFKQSYEDPITRARQRDATGPEIQLGNHMAESLRQLTQPYILRRTKEELMIENKENLGAKQKIADNGQDITALSSQSAFPKLSTKNELVVWVYMSPTQEKIYRDFIQLDSIKELLSSKRNPLVYLNVMKKICDHPRLLSTKACKQLGLLTGANSSFDEIDAEEYEECAANRIDNISDEILIEESAKLEFLIQLLLRLRKEGHRTLVFSLSRKMLNVIQRILMNYKFKIMRMDGLVTKLQEREKRVNLFQQDESYSVFLLTTQVGGVGLTLTGADRVIIYDPSWNPATDAQSVDRIYRIGQKKSVVVYRLISCGTVEEKIYRRQIFKNSMIEQSTCGRKDPFRYFSSQDLRELFVLDDVTSSVTQQQLEKLHAHQRQWDDELREHVQHIRTLKMYDISDHDLMFTRKPDDFDYETEMAGSQFNNRVEEAQMKLRLESVQLTGINEAETRWGGGVPNITAGNGNFDRNEPIYPIEGLNKELDALTFPTTSIGSSSSSRHSSDSPDLNNDASGGDSDNFIRDESESDKEEQSHNRPSLDLNSAISVHSTPARQPNSRQSLDHISTCGVHSTPVGQTNSNLPSFHEDDCSIHIVDSPGFTKHTQNLAENSPPPITYDHDFFSDDNLIAVDSPLASQNTAAPSIKITTASKNESFPTEIQESITIFSESENEEELDDSWKTAFSLSNQNPNLSTGSAVSKNDTPIGVRNQRRLRVIDSDETDSDSESLLKLVNSSRRSLNVNSSQNRRSVSAYMSANFSRLSASPEKSDSRNSFNSSGHSPNVDNSSDGSDTDLDEPQEYDRGRSVLRDCTNTEMGGNSREQSFRVNLSSCSDTSKNESSSDHFSLQLSDFEDEI